MDIGFDARTPGAVSDPAERIHLVAEGERLGFDYTTISDHLVSPTAVRAKYPYAADGVFPAVASGGRLEQLTAIAFLAAKTSRLRFVTSVMVVPYRPPVLAAKIMSTVDVLSGGRLTVGAGTGWMEDEFEALGVPSFSDRGRVTDEYLEAMKTLWTEPEPVYHGAYTNFSDIEFEPKPVQKPHPPLWIGGLSGPAMRRAARIGDAWYPVPNDQARPLDSLERVRAGIAKMRSLTEAADRDPDSVAIAMRVHHYGERLEPKASDGERRLFSGANEEIANDLRVLRELGVIAVDFRFAHDTAEKALLEMDAFRRDVIGRA